MMAECYGIPIMTLRVKPFCSSDEAAWLELWTGYLEFYRTALPSEVTATTWKRLLDSAHGIHGLGAFDDQGQLLGLVHYLFHPVTWSASERCYLEDLFVAPTARGQGVGEALIGSVFEAADSQGADQVYWLTEDNNLRAMRLYDRVGTRTPFIKYTR